MSLLTSHKSALCISGRPVRFPKSMPLITHRPASPPLLPLPHKAHLRPICSSSAPDAVLELTTPKQFSEHVDHGTGLVFVDFYAEWCGPCKLVERIFYSSAATLGTKATWCRLDTKHFDKTYLTTLNVRLLPTCQAYRNGKFVDEFVGARPSEFAAWLKKLAFRK